MIRILVVSLLLILVPHTSIAGSICGHVQDSHSGIAVANAGVFLRNATGVYTGDHTSTDLQGDYCIDHLLPGTYTLEVKVDDYVVAFVNGIEVADDVSTVPLSADMPAILLESPWPNPSSSLVNFRLLVQRTVDLEMAIFDIRGRVVRRWTVGDLEPGPHRYQWDGLDWNGRAAPAGLYFVRARTDNLEYSRPFLMTR